MIGLRDVFISQSLPATPRAESGAAATGAALAAEAIFFAGAGDASLRTLTGLFTGLMCTSGVNSACGDGAGANAAKAGERTV